MTGMIATLLSVFANVVILSVPLIGAVSAGRVLCGTACTNCNSTEQLGIGIFSVAVRCTLNALAQVGENVIARPIGGAGLQVVVSNWSVVLSEQRGSIVAHPIPFFANHVAQIFWLSALILNFVFADGVKEPLKLMLVIITLCGCWLNAGFEQATAKRRITEKDAARRVGRER